MPLPLIPVLLGGAALIAGGYGAKKGYDAKKNFDQASRITDEAKTIYDKTMTSLQSVRVETESQLKNLGRIKCELYEKTLLRFVNVFQTIKNIDFSDLNLTSDLAIDECEFAEIRETALKMTDVLGGAAVSLTGGALAGIGAFGGAGLLATASTGTAISTLSGVAATNATLAWFGGGALAAGGLGMAGGMVVLGGVVAAPVLLVGGLMMSSKSESAVSDAYSNLDKAKGAVEVMKSARTAARAILRRAEEMQDVLEQLTIPFEDHVDDLADLSGFNTDYRTYSERERKLVGATCALAKTVKNVMETPIFDEEGRVTNASRDVIGKARDFVVSLSHM